MPYFFLQCAVQWRNQPFPSPTGKRCDTGEDFCQPLPQKCVLGKVEQPVKQHLDHVKMKFSSENNANELPWNSISTMSEQNFPFQVTPMKHFKTVFRPHQTEIPFLALSSSSLLSPGPSLYKANSRSPSGSSQIVSGPGHHYSVASLHSEHKRRLLCAHIKGGLSNLGLALCW